MENAYNETTKILKQYKITANKKLGQNFLINDEVIEKIIECAEINTEDLIIEIGPGLGTLTNELIRKAGKVIAIELDKKMIDILRKRFSNVQNLEIINDDILKVDIKKIIEKEDYKNVKVVANLPYYITTPILMKLLEDNLKLESITVMVQKEVAERLTAKTGNRNCGAITYSVHFYSEPQKIIEVPKESFIPSPEVISEVIKLTLIKNPPIEVKNKEILFKLIKVAFMQRRKTISNSLMKIGAWKGKEELINMLDKLKINSTFRAEELTLEQFAKIANEIEKNIDKINS